MNWAPTQVPSAADSALFASTSGAQYTVTTPVGSFETVAGLLIEGNAVTLAGSVVAGVVTIGQDGGLGIGTRSFLSVTGDLEIGLDPIAPGGTLSIAGTLIDASATVGAGANVVVSPLGEWITHNDLTITGANTTLATALNGVSASTLSIADGATFVGHSGISAGTVVLTSGTLFEGGLSVINSVIFNGTSNLIDGVGRILFDANDGTLAGGFTIGGGDVALDGTGGLSDGVTVTGGTIELGSASAAGKGPITFAPGAAATLLIDKNARNFANVIEGFVPGDHIDFAELPYVPGMTATIAAGTLTLALGTLIEAQLSLGGGLSTVPLLLDTSTGTDTDISFLGEAATGHSGLWQTPTTWQPATTPADADSAVISAPGNYAITVDDSRQISDIVLDDAGASLVVTAGGSLGIASALLIEAGVLDVFGTLTTAALQLPNGGTVVVFGTLSFKGANGSGVNGIVVNGGTWDIIGAGTVVGSPFVTIAIGDTLTIDNETSNPFLLTANGAGSLITNGSITLNGQTGPITIAGGTLTEKYIVIPGVISFASQANAALQDTWASTTVRAGSGSDTIGVTSGFVTGYGGTGTLTFLGEMDFPTLPSNAATLYGGAGTLLAYGYAQQQSGTNSNEFDTNLFFGGAAGNNTLVGGVGAATLVGGGSGDILFAARATPLAAPYPQLGADVLVAGPGAETMTGTGSTVPNLYYGGPGNDLIVSGGGTDTIVAGNGAISIFGGEAVFAGGGQDLIIINAQPAYVQGGSGQATVFAGAEDIFGFAAGQAGGVFDIIGFQASDRIQLNGYGTDAAAAALNGATLDSGTTVLTLSDSTRIVLFGMTGLNQGNFM